MAAMSEGSRQVSSRRDRSARARARRIRCLVMDVDGVLTDGRMGLTERGDELKSFSSRDGVAVALARRTGITLALMTGETSPIAEVRGHRLGIDEVRLGVRRKGESLEALMREHGFPAEVVAYMGDDLLDLPALQLCGLAVAPADAAPEVKAAAHVVTRARGGRGAAREIIEFILRAQGVWEKTVDAYVQDHGGRPLRWR
jgi:3-deoxy-D-manno-octulosonate 8-phosphate phosphatase (KDO 8-P phosphatase)